MPLNLRQIEREFCARQERDAKANEVSQQEGKSGQDGTGTPQVQGGDAPVGKQEGAEGSQP